MMKNTMIHTHFFFTERVVCMSGCKCACIQPKLDFLKEKTKPHTVFFEPNHDTNGMVYFSNLILRNY